MIIVIGCGGVGSYLIPPLCKLTQNILLMDGDTLEPKNLDRQLFSASDLGKNKAEALALRYGVQHRPQYFSTGVIETTLGDVLMVCADNHAARHEALAQCDSTECTAIIAANETHSAEAYYYQHEWNGEKLDPRVYYPEILTDRSGDPRRRDAGCTGEAQQLRPQLASANFMAAALALQLYVVWVMERPQLEDEALPHLPHKLTSTLTRLESFKAQV
jgi:molybdopterin/thiamine biosynthesis adenylyltransferase